MAKRVSPFVFRFLLVSILLPVLLLLVGWLFRDEVRAKSYYYRLQVPELLAYLDGARVDWQGEDLVLDLGARDTVLRCTPFQAKSFNKALYRLESGEGAEYGRDIPFEELPEPMRMTLRKVTELKLLNMRSPEAGQLDFLLEEGRWLHYRRDSLLVPQAPLQALDAHWYVSGQEGEE
jgi:hypothetical protein